MKKKFISLLLSTIIVSSFSINVKASEADYNAAPEAIFEESIQDESDELVENEEISVELEEDTNEDLTSSIEVTMFAGDVFDPEVLLESFIEDAISITVIESSLSKGGLDESSIGQHEVTITYEKNDMTSSTVSFHINVTGKPVIVVNNTTLLPGEPFTLDVLDLSAFDHEDGDLTEDIILKYSPVAIDEVPDETVYEEFEILLSVTDQHDNTTEMDVLLNIVEAQVTPQAVITNNLNKDTTLTIAGADRFQTAVSISKTMYSTTDAVMLVSANNFPDALAAGPLAKILKAPILLTNTDRLNTDTLNEIKRLGATKVYMLGGEAAVSSAVEKELKSLSLQVERIAGKNRYATAIAAAELIGFSSTIILANGNDFADAMTAGSYASISGYPIMLTRSDILSTPVETYLDEGVSHVLIIGGATAISPAIESVIRNKGINVIRVAGSDRFNTSVEMAKYAFSGSTAAVVTNGMDFADALTAVPYAASLGLPVLLTSQNKVSAGINDYLVSSSISNFHFIGGEAAISNEVKNNMMYPSLYPVSYKSMDLKGTWSTLSKNGEPTGSSDGTGMSYIEMAAGNDKDVYIRYAVSVTGLGWLPIKQAEPAGAAGRAINGLVMELKGKDAVDFEITYRAFIKNTGWTEWLHGGVPAGGIDGQPILAVETRIIHGNALDISEKIDPSYGIVKADLNLRSGPSTSYQKIGVIPNESRIKIISISGLWAYVRYTDSFGKISYGYVHTGYVDITKGIITITGLENGDYIPKDNHMVTGDIAYKEGIKEVNYYVNNIFIGRVDYGYLSNTSLAFEFDYPMQTGYQVNIPVESWIQGQINVLKVEFVGLDNRREFEARYLMPYPATSDEYVFEQNSKSFHTYLKIETAKTNPAPQVWTPNGWMDATLQQTTEAMDPTYYLNHETYKYIFLDLGYNESDYTVTTAQLDAILKDKGVLHGMGHVFRQAAIDFKVNPFYLIAHSLHETGNGNSRLALGQQMDYYHEIFDDENSKLIPLSDTDRVKKWHNVYGIGAYDSNPILWGSERAYREGWDTVEKAIYGGAEWIANGYIDRSPWAQNTLYKMRYNLKENMTHQYATDIMWAQNQSKTIKKQFDNMGVVIPLRFIIPTFGEIRN